MKQIFTTYKLNFKLESLKILSLTASTAKIQIVTLTTKVSGPAFKNNRVKLTTDLIKRGGKWLMRNSKVNNIEYVD